MFDFFYGNETEQYQFYRVPQALFTNEKFIRISCEAKLLYGFLLDRCGLSQKNKWYDDDEKIYVFFKQEEAIEKLNIGKNKAVKIFNELEQIGLIIRKKQGQGKPTKIYVCNFTKELCSTPDSQTSPESTKEEVKTPENRKSEKSDSSENMKEEVKTPKNGKSKLPKTGSQYIYSLNHTERNHTNPSIYQNDEIKQTSEIDGWTDRRAVYEFFVKERIEYNALVSKGVDRSTLDLIVDIILEAYNPATKSMIINCQFVSANIVRRQYEKLDSSHIEYVLERVRDVSARKKIKFWRNYLRSSLYNAPHTIDLHYDNEVNYDFSQYKE